jgi:hypothetical protein
MADIDVNKSEAITMSESVTQPVSWFKFTKSKYSATMQLITADWSLVDQYPRYKDSGVLLKGIILIPGSGAPDTFVIMDGAADGPYLYKAALSVATVLVYPGTLCKPMIDFSECTLTTGHAITFVW